MLSFEKCPVLTITRNKGIQLSRATNNSKYGNTMMSYLKPPMGGARVD